MAPLISAYIRRSRMYLLDSYMQWSSPILGWKTAEFWPLDDPVNAELRQAMLDEYLPRVGSDFEQGLDAMDAVGVRIAPEKMFTFHMEGDPPPAGA